MHRGFRETDEKTAVLRRFFQIRRTSRLDGAVLLRRNVLDADEAGLQEKRLRPDFGQVPDQHCQKPR